MAQRGKSPLGGRGPLFALLILIAAAVGAFQLFQGGLGGGQPEVMEEPGMAAPDTSTEPRPGEGRLAADPAQWPAGTRAIPYAAGDPRTVEINRTLDLIEAGGPFPYDKDGTTFYNREGRLPGAGNYCEYTVVTPGAGNRGARRLVVDRGSGVAWYTDDHYETFAPVARVRWPG